MNILIYDLETVPTEAYVWSAWKQNVAPIQVVEQGRVVCWAAQWLGDKDRDIMFGSEWDLNPEKDFIVRLHDLFEEADAVITFNGDKFDELVANTEYMKRGLGPPPPRKSIDMYKVSKQRFRLLHHRMDSVAEALGIKGKTETGGFQLWRDIMDGKPAAQKLMEKYNKQDIKVLKQIYQKLLPWIKNHPVVGTGDACAHCGSTKLEKRGFYKTKVSTFQRYKCTKCGAWHRERLADKTAEKPKVVTI